MRACVVMGVRRALIMNTRQHYFIQMSNTLCGLISLDFLQVAGSDFDVNSCPVSVAQAEAGGVWVWDL